jgi:hypothetical protein
MSSRTEFSENEWKIIRLAQEGLSPIEIKAAIGRSTSRSISVVLCWARKAGVPRIAINAPGSGVKIPAAMYDYLELEAQERKMKTHDLVRAILKNVIDDDLFSAVLDK